MSSRRFDCDDVRALLDLEDDGLRPDRRALARHLADCPHCQQHAPELEWLYGNLLVEDIAPPERPAPRRVLRAAALACVAILAALPWFLGDRAPVTSESQGVTDVPIVESPEILPAHTSRFEAGLIRMLPDREIETRRTSAFGSPDDEGEDANDAMEWTR